MNSVICVYAMTLGGVKMGELITPETLSTFDEWVPSNLNQ